jgi:hypothetical protein
VPPGGSIGPIMLSNFNLVKNHKIAYNSETTEGTEKIRTYLESLEFYKNYDLCLTKFDSYLVLLDKISHRFLETAKLLSG